MTDWRGENPFYLTISHKGGQVKIDLDEPRWMKNYANLLRVPGVWVLMHKEARQAPLMVYVHEGDQPYYTARHVGVTGSGGGNEITAYGIGKKRPDGSVIRLWSMPSGVVCGGDDVDDIGIRMVHALGPKKQE